MLKKIVSLFFLFLFFKSISIAQIDGFVFLDLPFNGSTYNSYGSKQSNEDGLSGVTVTVYPSGATTTTLADGSYSFGPADATGSIRVEFSGWPNKYKPSPESGIGNLSIRFASGGDTDINFGLHFPVDYVQENPFISTSVYYEGAYNGPNSGSKSHVKLPLTAEGHDFVGVNPTVDYEGITNSTYNDIGTTYGSAWQKGHKKLYLGSYQKRYSGYGPNGPDAIYQLDPNTNMVTGVIELDALTSTFVFNGG